MKNKEVKSYTLNARENKNKKFLEAKIFENPPELYCR